MTKNLTLQTISQINDELNDDFIDRSLWSIESSFKSEDSSTYQRVTSNQSLSQRQDNIIFDTIKIDKNHTTPMIFESAEVITYRSDPENLIYQYKIFKKLGGSGFIKDYLCQDTKTYELYKIK